MHMLAPKPANRQLPIFFNLDSVVGASPAQNLSEDVMFVQFCLRFAGDHPAGVKSPELLPILRAVNPTGAIDTATIEAIRATQQSIKKEFSGTVVDGRVSPAHGYFFGSHGAWTIIHFNNTVQEQCKDLWPRLDKVLGCPAALAAAVIREVVGV